MFANESYAVISRPENDTMLNPWIYQFVGLVELFVAIVGTVFNSVVLLAACGKPKGMTFKSRRTITECLVISMSMADLTFSLFHAPLSFIYFYSDTTLTPWQCRFFYTTTHVSTIASSLSLLWLNVNKFLQLHRPLHYYLYMTKSRALMFIAVGWSISIGWGLFFVFGPFMSYDDFCNAKLQYQEVYIFFAIEFFLLPTAASLFVSVEVALLVLSGEKRRSRENFVRLSRFQRSRYLEPYQHQEPRANGKRRRSARDPSNVRKITFVFATTVWSALTVLPYRFAFTIHNFPGYRASDIGMTISFCFFALMALNAAGNPLITLLTHKHYARQIRGWFNRQRNEEHEEKGTLKCAYRHR